MLTVRLNVIAVVGIRLILSFLEAQGKRVIL